MNFKKGMKVKISIKGSHKSLKVQSLIKGIIYDSTDNFIVVKTKHYKTCINYIDFTTGQAVLI